MLFSLYYILTKLIFANQPAIFFGPIHISFFDLNMERCRSSFGIGMFYSKDERLFNLPKHQQTVIQLGLPTSLQ